MRKLLKYMKSYTLQSVLGPLFKLLEASFELFVPLVMAAIIDTGIAQGDNGYILRMCGVLAALAVIGLVCSITAQYFAARASVGFATKIRSACFAHIQSLSFAQQDKLGVSTLITRLTSDINQVQSGMNLALRLLLRSPFVVFGAMVMAFTIDVKAALVFVVTIPLLSVVVFGLMLWSIPMYKKVQKRLDGVLSLTRESLTGVRVVRAFCQEKDIEQDFVEKNDALTTLQKLVGKVTGLMNPVTYAIINLGIVALIWVGALRVDAGILTQGQVVALYNYMSQILVELVKLASLIISITKAMACASRVSAVMDVQPDMVSGDVIPESEGEEAVRFDNVTLNYSGSGAPELHGVSFTALRGQTIGVIGGTGAGKSTLVGLIPRFYDATEGCVKVDGTDVRDYPLEELRRRVGVVPQKAVLFKGSIRENMKWGDPDATDEQIWAALEAAQARDVVESKEDGLDAVIAQGGRNLSGGQRQRLTIARALVRQPEILILDDSASALDYATDLKLRQALRKLPGRPTVFIVSQRTSSIAHADQIIVLDEGGVVGMGTHAQLLENCPVYQEIYYSQYEKKEAK